MDSSFYTSCPTLITGCYLYQDNMGVTPVIDGYYSDYTDCFTVVSGVITSVNSCTGGTTSYQYLVNASATNGFATQSPACTGTTIYPIWTSASTIGSITTGTTLFSDVNLTSTWAGQAEWYGIGTSYGGIPISGFQIDNSGDVILINTCPECYNYTIEGQAGLLPGERIVNYTSCDGTPSSIAASTTQIYTICAQRNSVIPEYPEAPIVITRTTLCN